MSATSNSRVKVVVRVRPLLESERGQTTELLQLEDEAIVLHNHRSEQSGVGTAATTSRRFPFHDVFNETAGQDALAGSLLPDLMDAIVGGYNGTILAYGQTGSGKSYTMDGHEYEYKLQGGGGAAAAGRTGSRKMPRACTRTTPLDSDKLGITPRAIRALFDRIRSSTTTANDGEGDGEESKRRRNDYVVRCSFLQIYNEQILDLLGPNASNLVAAQQQQQQANVGNNKVPIFQGGLKLRWSQQSEFYVEDLSCPRCESAEEAMQFYQQGVQCKIMAAHDMNATSSRSHCLFTLYLEQHKQQEEGGGPEEADGVVRSRFTLVDLAGSERVAQTGATGRTLMESIGINKSLFTLRQVIQALADQQQQQQPGSASGSGTVQAPPYREAKLTSLLKHSLGGNSHTVMIACLSPSDLHASENQNTLTYASRAQAIVNMPVVNLDPRCKLIASLRAENAQLKAELHQTQATLVSLQAAVQEGRDPAPFLTNEPTSGAKEEAGGESAPLHTNQTAAAAAHASSVSARPPSLAAEEEEEEPLVKLLMNGERVLRERQGVLQGEVEAAREENGQLQEENRELRERMELLEYLVATYSSSSTAATTTTHGDSSSGTDNSGGGVAEASPSQLFILEGGQGTLWEEDLSSERHRAMARQIAHLTYHNGLLKQELQQARQQQQVDMMTTTTTNMRVGGGCGGGGGKSNGQALPAAASATTKTTTTKHARAPLLSQQSAGRSRPSPPQQLGPLTNGGSSTPLRRRDETASSSIERQHQEQETKRGPVMVKASGHRGGGRHAGALSLGDLKNLLSAGGGAGGGGGGRRSSSVTSQPQEGDLAFKPRALFEDAFHQGEEQQEQQQHHDVSMMTRRSRTTGQLLLPSSSSSSSSSNRRAEAVMRRLSRSVGESRRGGDDDGGKAEEEQERQRQKLQSLNTSLRRALMEKVSRDSRVEAEGSGHGSQKEGGKGQEHAMVIVVDEGGDGAEAGTRHKEEEQEEEKCGDAVVIAVSE